MENKLPLGFVYYLQNPITGEIFYVGATEISIGWIVANRKYLFKYGFEINEFISNKNAYGNIFNYFKNNRKGNPYGYQWELFSNLDIEIQDIVHTLYENKE